MATLAEDLFLLAHHEVSGKTVIATAYLDLGLGGAMLNDLALHGRVALANSHVTVIDSAPTGDRLLDHALATIAGSTRGHEPDYWVRHLAKGARAAVQDRLIVAGVLRLDDHRLFGMIPVHRTPEIDARVEHELVARLYDAVVAAQPPSTETAALVSLASAVGLQQHLFPRSDRRAVRHRMQQLAGGEWAGAAVRHTIDAINAALGIAVSAEEAENDDRS